MSRINTSATVLDVTRRYGAWLTIAIGALLCLGAGGWDITKTPGAVAGGIGTGLLSAAVFAKITGLRSDFAEILIQQGVDDLFKNRSMDFDDDDWSRLMLDARTHYRVLGMANHGYIRNFPTEQQTASDFRAMLKGPAQVQILWLNPECPQAELRNRQEQKRDTIADTARSIIWFWEFRKTLDDSKQNRMHLLTYDDIPSCGVHWADDQLIVTHYLAASLNLDSPGLVLRSPAIRMGRLRVKAGKTPPLTRLYEQHYSQVHAGASPLTVERMPAIRDIQRRRSTGASEADLRPDGGQGTK